MTDPTDEGPEAPPPGPLSDTFGEFVQYARNRRKKGPRQAPAPPPRAVPQTTVRQAAFAAATVVSFFLVLLIARVVIGPSGKPAVERVTKGRVSDWIDLPRPAKMGEVPDGWGPAKLGMRLQDLPAARRVAYAGGDTFADFVYTPDPAKPDSWFGVSFYKERLYRVAVRYGESSTIPTTNLLGAAAVAYGRARSYEYPTTTARHVVSIFQSETRALKIDSVKTDEALNVCDVVLVDLEQGAARELARARGGH